MVYHQVNSAALILSKIQDPVFVFFFKYMCILLPNRLIYFQVMRRSWKICLSSTKTSSHSWTAEVGLLSTKQPSRQTKPFWNSHWKVCILCTFVLQTNWRLTVTCCPASGPDSVDCCTPRGQTPLFLAVEQGLMGNASFLLQHGAQPNSQDQEQDTPLLAGIGRQNTPLALRF